ncbi:hypothetical protein TYRP_000719, partial [Tyrophagus putrescentiae]
MGCCRRSTAASPEVYYCDDDWQSFAVKESSIIPVKLLLTGTGNPGPVTNKPQMPFYSAQFYHSNDTKFGDVQQEEEEEAVE